MQVFIMEQDDNKRDSFAIRQSDVIYNVVLAASVEKTVTVPSGANIAIFASTGNFYCRFNATVAVPVADVVTGLAGEINPTSRVVTGVSTVHVVAPADCILSISFYKVNRAIA